MKNKFLNACMVLLLSLLVISCEKEKEIAIARPQFNIEQPDEMPQQVYDIYSLVIKENCASCSKIVIQQKSSASVMELQPGNHIFDYLTQTYSTFDTSLATTYSELNKTEVHFGEQFQSDDKELVLVSTDELNYIFDDENIEVNWKEFYHTFDNSSGYIWFSNVAINESETQAILELGHVYGSLGGDGTFVYLEKQNGNWVIVENILTWIA